MTQETQQQKVNVVVVGDPALARHDAFARQSTVTVACDYLHALGEMSRRHVDVVVSNQVPESGSVESVTRALRQLAPDARLLLITDAGDEPAAMAAVRHGFDDYYIQPLRPGELQEALADLAAHTPHLPVEVEAPVSESTLPVAAAGEDVALVNILLSDRGSVREGVMVALRRKYGQDIYWAAEPDLTAQACVSISTTDSTLGYLISDSISDGELAPAATWAACWLALEKRIIGLKHEANRDNLTDAWNRRYFQRFLDSVLARARDKRFRVTLLLFDIDDFKRYNDEFGHAAGDDILCEAVRLMQSVVRRQDVVARIGGDEFAVIFWDAEAPRKEQSEHPRTARRAAWRFQKAICDHRFPKLADLAPGTLTISGGLASFPWDGQTSEELMQIADDALLESKRQGKNAITLGPGALRICGDPD